MKSKNIIEKEQITKQIICNIYQDLLLTCWTEDMYNKHLSPLTIIIERAATRSVLDISEFAATLIKDIEKQ